MHTHPLVILFAALFFLVPPLYAQNCIVAGCNQELCVEKDTNVFSTCLWKAEYGCYQEHGICAAGANGICGWQGNPKLSECLQEMQGAVDMADPFPD